jgi:hypothetical protein
MVYCDMTPLQNNPVSEIITRRFPPIFRGGWGPLSIIAVLCLMVASCSLFETRDPEEPGTTTVPVFIQPDRPQDVIQNLQNAVRTMNLDNYRRCLEPEIFSYQPSSVAQSSNPDLWQGWGFAEEEAYFNNMRAETEGLSGHELRLDNRRFVQISADREQFDADYRITVEHNRQGLPVVAEGVIRLIIVRDESGNWAIESWSDAADGSDFTWSDFRAAFL